MVETNRTHVSYRQAVCHGKDIPNELSWVCAPFFLLKQLGGGGGGGARISPCGHMAGSSSSTDKGCQVQPTSLIVCPASFPLSLFCVGKIGEGQQAVESKSHIGQD